MIFKSMVLKRHLFLVMLFCSPIILLSQEVYQDLTNTGIYNFIDELANQKVITISSVVKPYSRSFIASKLKEARMKDTLMNRRQKKELEFYLKDFNLELQPNLEYFKKPKGLLRKKEKTGIPLSPLSFVYKDSAFVFSIRPVLGIEYFAGKKNTAYHRWEGAEIFGTIGKHFGFYTSLRDHHESILMVDPGVSTLDEGAAWKVSGNGGDYSEMRGGISYAWSWGSVLLAKDHFEWGDNYHGSNILSGRTPSFPFFQLKMKPAKWLDYTFITAWLISDIVDDSRSYKVHNGTRNYYFNKFLSACIVTFTPWKRLNLSLGNSVISCSRNYNPSLLSPFLFYIHSSSSGTAFEKSYYGRNSQFFINLSTRQLGHFHIYSSLFMDDLGFTKFPNGKFYDCLSWKTGFRVSNIFRSNLSLTAEYTRTTPETYTYPVPTLTYYSNNYNLGNYLGDNSQELFIQLDWKPFRGFLVKTSYCLVQHGASWDSYTLEKLLWGDAAWNFNLSYEIINNAYITLGFQQHFISGTAMFLPKILQTNDALISGGVNIGF